MIDTDKETIIAGDAIDSAVTERVATYLSLRPSLCELVPEFNWSNLLADYGEYIAIRRYRLGKAKTGEKGFDAIRGDGKTVQVKTVRKSTKSIKFRRGADYLLVLLVKEDAAVEEIYYGNFNKIFEYAYETKVNGEFTLGIGSIRKISERTLAPREPIVLTLPSGAKIQAPTRREMLKKLKVKGFDVPKESTLNQRIGRDNWELERAFGIKVPPNYAEVESYVDRDGYSWYPHLPTEHKDRAPLVYHPEKRIYISQTHFSAEHDLPNDYLSDKLTLGWDLSRIVATYRAQKLTES